MWPTVANQMTPSWVEGFARSTWCLSYFRAPEARIVVAVNLSRSAECTQQALHTDTVVNSVECKPGHLIPAANCTVICWGDRQYTGSLCEVHGWFQRTVCIQAGVTVCFNFPGHKNPDIILTFRVKFLRRGCCFTIIYAEKRSNIHGRENAILLMNYIVLQQNGTQL